MIKRILSCLAAAGLVLAVTAAPAAAQIGWSIGAGLSLPNSDLKTAYKSGFNAMAAANIPLTGAPLSIRVDGMYNTFSGKVSPTPSLTLITVSADAKYAFAPGPVSPYILGGPTWSHGSCSGCTSQSAFGYNLGGGINFGMSALKLFVEARYFSTSKNGATTKWIPITLGIHF